MNLKERLASLRVEAAIHGDTEMVEMVVRIEDRCIRLYDIETNLEIEPDFEPESLVGWCRTVIESLDTTEPSGAVDYLGTTAYAWGAEWEA